jgi:hypothetical protein
MSMWIRLPEVEGLARNAEAAAPRCANSQDAEGARGGSDAHRKEHEQRSYRQQRPSLLAPSGLGRADGVRCIESPDRCRCSCSPPDNGTGSKCFRPQLQQIMADGQDLNQEENLNFDLVTLISRWPFPPPRGKYKPGCDHRRRYRSVPPLARTFHGASSPPDRQLAHGCRADPTHWQ